MQRIVLEPRPNWQKRLEDEGCFYHTMDGKPYWRDDAAYVFTAEEVDRIEEATDELHKMCLAHCADVIERGEWDGYGFPDEVKKMIHQSWSIKEPHLFGRFDLGYDGTDLKLFELNADTPTALPEAAVWQWHAKEDRGWPDQYNSIHEKLVARWPHVVGRINPRWVYFVTEKASEHEDWGNLHYLLETAAAAGFSGSSLAIDDVGWHAETKMFRDVHETPMLLCMKLYPWEMMMADEFGWNTRHTGTRFVEPAWKMLLSTKALLPHLWKKHRDHPLLLEAYFEEDVWGAHGLKKPLDGEWLRKPLLGREGANVTLAKLGHDGWDPKMQPGFRPEYDTRGYVVQRLFRPQSFPVGNSYMTPVIGSWVIGDKACGMGIREDEGFITTNASCFVPHYFEAT